jgi:signal recognition particle receptor subunit beta
VVQMNLEFKEVAVKVVYYGPALSGKTTNLQSLHGMFNSKHRGRLMTLETQSDRTLFFDLLPLQYKTPSGLSVKLKLYTVPGQVIHNSTRRAVLAGVDAVAFVADSQKSQALSNSISFNNLKENLKVNGIDFDALPIVMQFNKRDLQNLKPVEEIKRDWGKSRFPTFLSIATQSKGVVETFECLIRMAFKSLDKKYEFNRKFGFDINEFINNIATDKMKGFDMRKEMISQGNMELQEHV